MTATLPANGRARKSLEHQLDRLDSILDGLADVFFQHLEDSQGCALDIELWAEAQSNPRVREAVRRVGHRRFRP